MERDERMKRNEGGRKRDGRGMKVGWKGDERGSMGKKGKKGKEL